MKVAVEDLSTVKKILHIEIPETDVAGELDEAYKNIKNTAKIKGFRPGKAPRSVLERLFKKGVNADVSSKLLKDSFLEALKETDLRIVGNPQIDPPEFNGKGPYKYDATVEINPALEDIDFSGLSLKRNLYSINDNEMDMQLKMLQKNMAQQNPIEDDREVRDGDFVQIDYEGYKDGKPFDEISRTENFVMKIGEGKILKELDKQIIGMKPKDKKEINVTFPDDYFNKNLVGLEIAFQLTLHEIRKEILPDIDDELAKKFGNYKTLDEMKDAIKNNLKQGYEKRVEQELNEQIFEALIAKTDFELPDSIVNQEYEGILQETERSFEMNNMSMEKLGFSKEDFEKKCRDTAEKQVRRHYILNKIVEQKELALSDEDLENGYKEMSQSNNFPVEEIKKYYMQNKENLGLFKNTLLEKQAIKLILDNSNIEDVKPEEKQEPESSVDGSSVTGA